MHSCDGSSLARPTTEEIVLYVSPDRPDAWERGGFEKLVAELLPKGKTVWVSCEDKLQRL